MSEPVLVALLFADRVITEDNNKKAVIGIARKRVVTRADTGKKTIIAEYPSKEDVKAFPRFNSVLLDEATLTSLFSYLVSGRTLKYSDAASYGINTYDQWVNFAYEVFDNSRNIANALGVKGSIVLEKQNDKISLRYR